MFSETGWDNNIEKNLCRLYGVKWDSLPTAPELLEFKPLAFPTNFKGQLEIRAHLAIIEIIKWTSNQYFRGSRMWYSTCAAKTKHDISVCKHSRAYLYKFNNYRNQLCLIIIIYVCYTNTLFTPIPTKWTNNLPVINYISIVIKYSSIWNTIK